jgi:hypothetical protein
MKKSTITRRINEIKRYEHDPETSHAMTDKLYVDVLDAIADNSTGADTPQDLAAEVLKLRDLNLTRWYA